MRAPTIGMLIVLVIGLIISKSTFATGISLGWIFHSDWKDAIYGKSLKGVPMIYGPEPIGPEGHASLVIPALRDSALKDIIKVDHKEDRIDIDNSQYHDGHCTDQGHTVALFHRDRSELLVVYVPRTGSLTISKKNRPFSHWEPAYPIEAYRIGSLRTSADVHDFSQGVFYPNPYAL